MSLSFTLSPEQVERLLKGFETMERSLTEIRAVYAESASTMFAQPQPQPQNMGQLGIPNIDRARWRIKGGGDATPNDTWAFCFAHNQNGTTSPENQAILDYLSTHSGRFKVNGYSITLSRDGKFINRSKK